MIDDFFAPQIPCERKTLFPHQERALELLYASLARGSMRPLMQGPCGFGKTVIAARIFERALEHCERALFVAPRADLIDQTIAAFHAEGLSDIGAMQADHPLTDRSARVQVATVQTLDRRAKPDGVGLVIVDEAHEIHKSIVKLMHGPRWLGVPFIGLSATPWAAGLGKIYDDLIVAATTAELIEAGFLSPFVVYAPATPDLSGVRTVAGEFHQEELAQAVDRPQIVGDIVDNWLKRGENRQTLCFSVNRAHAQHLQQRFREAGVPADYLDCFSDRTQRQIVFERFRNGECRVICNVNLLTTGFDAPATSCIIDAHPTKSLIRYVQAIGRGLRPAPGKENTLIFDHAGNALRLGLVTDIGFDRLDDGDRRAQGEREKKDRTPLPKLCDDCKAVIPQHAMSCPQCGARVIAKTDVRVADGRLVRIGSGESGVYIATIDEKARFFGEVKHIARERGYRDGWAAYKFRERFGVWPNDPRVRYAPLLPPSLETIRWVRSRQIAYAKARAANG